MDKQEAVFLNSLFFVLGFTAIFSIIGVMFQTILSHASFSVIGALRIVGGILIICFGALIVASSRYPIPFFSTEHKIRVKRLSNSYLSSFLFGIAFALGWTPCVGAILGAIYVLAATSPGISFLLLLFYSLGLGIPFLIAGAMVSRVIPFLKRIRTFLKYFSIVSGAFLVVLGVMVVTGYIGILSVFLLGVQAPGGSGAQLNLFAALIAGVLTFLSPCILPLVPAYLSYIVGTATDEARK